MPVTFDTAILAASDVYVLQAMANAAGALGYGPVGPVTYLGPSAPSGNTFALTVVKTIIS